MPARPLLTSFTADRTPDSQRRCAAALVAAAELGETHLNVSTLAGDDVALGAFHLDPSASTPGTVWRRRSGGRAVACGAGFVVVSLALPHRAALVSQDRFALRPEQVMNRCVRGILAWLQHQAIDPIYPGLDAITVGRRTLAQLSFAETAPGPTLFHAVVAVDGTFATTAHLLDRIDPQGRIPTRIIARTETTSLTESSPHWSAGIANLDLGALTAGIAAGYAEAFTLEVAEIDPGVTALLEADDEDDEALPREPLEDAVVVSDHGLLGAVSATARVAGNQVTAFALSGDFLAPTWAVRELCSRIEGGPATADAVGAAADSVLDGSRGYVLGMQPVALRRLLARAVTPDR